MGQHEVELTADEKYKKMLDAKLSQMMTDVMMGKKNGFKLPGTKGDDKPKELSSSAKKMIELLARQKAMKEIKQNTKKLQQAERAIKAEKKAKEKTGSIFFDVPPTPPA